MASSLINRYLLGLLGMGIALCLGCSGQTIEHPEQEFSNTAAAPLYVKSSVVWPSNTIKVCWENPSASNATQRMWVRDAVAKTWTAASPVFFTGWSTCDSFEGGIHIRISDEGPHVKVLGKHLSFIEDGMVLNFTFANWGQSCQSNLEFCIRAIAVHEFGHALGFAHEQNRPDSPSWCDQEQGDNGDWVIGPWDLDSVMNYCNPSWNGNGQLSAGDVAGVRAVYGSPPVCGNYVCNYNEDPWTCPTDCYCGDRVCHTDELSTCEADCGPP